MNGREMTADDVVSSLKRLLQAPNSWINFSQPAIAKPMTVEKTGPWEVTIKAPVDYLTSFFWVIQGGGFNRVYPPEVVAKYGDVGNWRNTVGTGPFMLTDYVPGSQLVYTRNANYWEGDPIGPGKGNQLPYVDNVRELIIPDLSTNLAALRTGKLDLQIGIVLTDARSLIKTNPKLQYTKYLSNVPYVFAMRQDKPNMPYSNLKVRQAMMLATDLETFKKNYYGGEAEIDVFPVNLNFKNAGAYAPLNEMPESAQSLYRYDPDKAKQLLKEAGYPNGFKVTAIVSSGGSDVDEAAVFKDMWAKAGIDLTLDVRDVATYNNFVTIRNYDDMIYRSVPASWPVMFYFSPIRGVSANNPSYVNDPPGADAVIESTFQAMDKQVMKNMPDFFRLFKELRPHLMEQSYVIPRPTPYTYTFWWPWLKNYYGQSFVFMRYHWIDQAMKKSMGY
jgi:peptide/nickel transport system substrate-binding protein